jgi:DNA-binding IscR family transcriptional regulator
MTMDAKIQVLKAMQKEGIPLNAGKIAELTNLDRKLVDKAMADLKAEELIVSPKRCYWQAK